MLDQSKSQGHVDFYGYDPSARGYVVGGWASHNMIDDICAGNVTLISEAGELAGQAFGATYARPSLGELGVGIVVFVAAKQHDCVQVRALKIGTGSNSTFIAPAPSAEATEGVALSVLLTPILKSTDPAFPREILQRLAPESVHVHGAIDLAGQFGPTFALSGWSGLALLGELRLDVKLTLSTGTVTASAMAVFYDREELDGIGVGTILLADATIGANAVLRSVLFEVAGETVVLTPTPGVKTLNGPLQRKAFRALLDRLDHGHTHDRLKRLTQARGYRGKDTLDELTDFVRVEIDDAIACPPNGLILIGWMLAHPDTVDSIELHSGPSLSLLPSERCLRIARADVAESVGRPHGLTEARCGFIAFFPTGHTPHGTAHLEIHTRSGEIGYRGIPIPRLFGVQAIERILATCDFQYADLEPSFDHVLGPAITLLNRHRLQQPTSRTVIQFGPQIQTPRCSIIVPLYRRLDYMDFQLGLLAIDPPGESVEFIYVLDDPPQRREAENLAALLHARHGVSITLICLDRNLGFAPASNIGLQAARGEFVCFLNSDVFPTGPGWLDRLADHLAADATLGAVGPMLLYEDGAVQHAGMTLHRVPQFGNWFFGDHPGKGLKPGAQDGLHPCISITGACMVLSRATADALGGFDEGYVIGDFEDSDLCLRLQQRGLRCAVDLGARLYHLERKSQSSSALRWRMNLTLTNAWLHHQRWGSHLAAIPQAIPS